VGLARRGRVSCIRSSAAAQSWRNRTTSEANRSSEEAAFAYKDIEAVMAASASLVKPVRRLTPLSVVKG
jgi:RNA-splicing ligase RtcB